MMRLTRYSEPYNATGGLAAEGVLNQLGRPDIEPLEVLVREAVQNCWDAKRPSEPGIRVQIGRSRMNAERLNAMRRQLLVDPPDGLPLAHELRPGMETLYFADFGTSGLGGPTRADEIAEGEIRDFVDFVRNIGQPPDKVLGGGSFGYGKAAFYIASSARTVLVDTLCETVDGRLERRFIGSALGSNYTSGGRPHTGRHWWGRMVDGVPEPLINDEAAQAAELLDLPARNGRSGLGTTVVVVAPDVAPEAREGMDGTMEFLADALVWNFWPRMTSAPGGARSTMSFRLTDDGNAIRIPEARTHQRLRGFVEAMDRLRVEPDSDDELVIDRPIECLRPIKTLGRLILQKGPVAPVALPERGVPQGMRQTAASLHHVALMRNAELVVKYLAGPVPVTGRFGYAGVFRCAVDVDAAFRKAEPPTHDDWIYRSLPSGHDRRFVKIALERITQTCRQAAGYDSAVGPSTGEGDVPLGEFADALATLMPGLEGPGARRTATDTNQSTRRRRRRHAPGSVAGANGPADVWVEAEPASGTSAGADAREGNASGDRGDTSTIRPPRSPQARSSGDPRPAIASNGSAVIRFPFELRGHGNRVRLTAVVEVMTTDGAQLETDAPRGYERPPVSSWMDPSGTEHRTAELTVGPDGVDGSWVVEVPLRDETMMRLDVVTEVA